MMSMSDKWRDGKPAKEEGEGERVSWRLSQAATERRFMGYDMRQAYPRAAFLLGLPLNPAALLETNCAEEVASRNDSFLHSFLTMVEVCCSMYLKKYSSTRRKDVSSHLPRQAARRELWSEDGVGVGVARNANGRSGCPRLETPPVGINDMVTESDEDLNFLGLTPKSNNWEK